jgi:dihydropteroate synthase-like protein
MPRYLFVTGKLAAQSLGKILNSESHNAEHGIAVLPISVAALMDTGYIARHLSSTMGCDIIVIPGLCSGDPNLISDRFGIEVIRGPKNLKEIPMFLGSARPMEGYGSYDLKIIAEIVDAYKLSLEEISTRAAYFGNSGADVIDLGCPPEGGFPGIGAAVKKLKTAGFLVSVDSFNPEDILIADRAGVDFLLSVNSRNMDLVRQLHCTVVAVPDFDQDLESLERNIAQLDAWHVPYIIDPVLNPIGFGFAESIGNFISVRRRYPRAEMLMGLGNITELTDADTTGITAAMTGIITELEIHYVLTTEVVSWARGAVRELDIARKLMHYACRNKILPKHLERGLITVKDPPFETFNEEELRAMQAGVRDRNFRIFTDRQFIYVFNHHLFVKGTDIQAIFDQLRIEEASEAFYLGKELQKALLALKLGKEFVQEQELSWGYLPT